MAGSVGQALGALSAVVPAIVGLAGVLPRQMASAAAVAVGIGLLAQGGSIAARFGRLIHETAGARWDSRTELGSGLTADLVGGLGGVVLGGLALQGIAPTTLVSIAALVIGGALVVGSSVTVNLATMSSPSAYDRRARRALDATRVAAGVEVAIGVASIALAILALDGIAPATLNLVALLAIGASMLFGGSALGGRMSILMRR